MNTDLSLYTKDELLLLNEQIRVQLKIIMEREASENMEGIKIGDIVSFQNNGIDVQSIIVRKNKKTISVLTEEECKWSLSPNFVKKVSKPSTKITNLHKELFSFIPDVIKP